MKEKDLILEKLARSTIAEIEAEIVRIRRGMGCASGKAAYERYKRRLALYEARLEKLEEEAR